MTVSERRDIAPEQWCAEVLDGLGAEAIAGRISVAEANTELTVDFNYDDEGYHVACKLGSLSLDRTGFQSPAVLQKHLEDYEATALAQIDTGGEVASLGGITGDYLYDATGTIPGAVFIADYADTEIIAITMLMPGELLSETEAQTFLDALARKAGSTGVPIVIKNYG